ncbi:radical SAM protein [Bradyrhizobium sp. B117]|uniref:radical SAM protein n=1 Tax=Bradyrhizobium sp. B117 TaxID=3140246 RepID=UPI0031836DE0
MHIVLISPRNPRSFWTLDGSLPVLGKPCVLPNLALPTIAALTPQPHTVELVDENVEAVDFRVDADLIGITGFIVHKERMFELIAGFKAEGKRVAVGGSYATLCPEDFEGKVDVLFAGEAEETWPRFLEDFSRGDLKPIYRAPQLPDIASRPIPRFDLLRTKRYRTMLMQFARGCPFECEFCDIIVMYGRKPRTKSVTSAMAEVDALYRLGASSVFLVDDNFIGNRARAKDFLRALAEWQQERGYPITFQTEASINLARDDELLGLMRAAHFRSVFIGIESPRKVSLKETRKVQNAREDMVVAVHKIQSFGIEVQAGMIVGFDADDPSIFEEHFRFLEEARIPISMTGLLNALPKTPLYERLEREGRLLGTTTGDQFVFTNIMPAGMTRLELYRGYRELLEDLYNHKLFRRRALKLIRHIGGGGARFSLRDVDVFFRYLWYCILGADKSRAALSISLLAAALIYKPSRLGVAVSLAIWHVHLHDFVRTLSPLLSEMQEALARNPASNHILPAQILSQDPDPSAFEEPAV